MSKPKSDKENEQLETEVRKLKWINEEMYKFAVDEILKDAS